MDFRSTLKRRCFRCFCRGLIGVGTSGRGKGVGGWVAGADAEEIDVRADATLSAGEAERGLEFDVDVEREWAVYTPYGDVADAGDGKAAG